MSDTANPAFVKLSILLVEDELFAQKLAVRVLNQIGVKNIAVAKSGTDAMTILGYPNSKAHQEIEWVNPMGNAA